MARERTYTTRTWKEVVRPNHLAAYPLCGHCLALGKRAPATQVDHILPISKGGAPYDHDNLQSLCASCHSRKTSVDKGARQRPTYGVDGYPIDVGGGVAR